MNRAWPWRESRRSQPSGLRNRLLAPAPSLESAGLHQALRAADRARRDRGSVGDPVSSSRGLTEQQRLARPRAEQLGRGVAELNERRMKLDVSRPRQAQGS